MNDQEQQGGGTPQETGSTGPSGAQEQPDQSVPPTSSDSPDPAQDASPTPVEPDPAPRDQVAEQAAREADLNDQQYEHAQRTGGGAVNVDEVEAQRDEHNERTGGGVVDDSQDQA